MLNKDDKYFCDVCCCHQEAFRQNKIKELPNILICHLMRFDGSMRKLMHRVVVPMEMKLCNTSEDAANADDIYNLFAIVVHSGNSLNHGHYFSLIKRHDQWILFDDDHFEPVSESFVERTFGNNKAYAKNTDRCYILFYEKSSYRPPLQTKPIKHPQIHAKDMSSTEANLSEDSSAVKATILSMNKKRYSNILSKNITGRGPRTQPSIAIADSFNKTNHFIGIVPNAKSTIQPNMMTIQKAQKTEVNLSINEEEIEQKKKTCRSINTIPSNIVKHSDNISEQQSYEQQPISRNKSVEDDDSSDEHNQKNL